MILLPDTNVFDTTPLKRGYIVLLLKKETAMTLATLTKKGQVTISKEIRESLRLHTGDKIEIIITDKREAVIRPVQKKRTIFSASCSDPAGKLCPLKL